MERFELRFNGRFNKRQVIFLCAFLVTVVLSMQLVAATAWTADAANAGPGVVIVQLSDDPDTEWAVADLQHRLSEFITDDPFFVDRVVVRRTSDPHVAETMDGQIVIYVSHGGPLGLVTGSRLTSWKTMAQIVTDSKASMHLFTACYSRNLITYGDEGSGKKLYTVPGARPAEVTNVEITTTVMLALGIDADSVEQYRTSELTVAKELIETGQSVHLMDFEQIILSEIETIDSTYSDTYTDTHRVYRYVEEDLLTGVSAYVELPYDLQEVLQLYFGSYLDAADNVVVFLPFYDCRLTYTRNYYYEGEWVIDYPDPEPPPEPDPDPEPIIDDPPIGPASSSQVYLSAATSTDGHWEYGPHIFCGGTYSGWVSLGYDGYNNYILSINVTASGPTIDTAGTTEIDSMSLRAIAPKGTYVLKQKVDGVWGEPVVGRDPARTGGLWTDPATRADYEYTPNVLPIPCPSSTGSLYSNGDYIYVTSIPTGTGWHGPTFIHTLPSYFKICDLGSFSANLSLVHGGDGSRESQTCVSLYDENMKIILSLMIVDASSGQNVYFVGAYYELDGSTHLVQSQTFSGDTIGVVTIRYDPQTGLYVKVPGAIEQFLAQSNQIILDRLIKYAAIQSYRYSTVAEHDERIYNIRLSYAASEYTVFHDNCNDMNEFQKDLTFPYGTPSEGVLSVPTGQSYMKWSSIPTGTGLHGPQYVHVLDRPFRLYQLSEFSVIGELIQSASTIGFAYVGLFDENKQCVLLMHWGDAWVGSQKGWFNTYFYPQYGGSYYQQPGYIYTSFMKTGKLWWGEGFGGEGAIYSSIDGSGSAYPIGECDNASRVIKYVVALGYRADWYNLVDMRINDINVVADPNKHAPIGPDPVVADGTYSRPLSTPDADQTYLSILGCVFDHIVSFWTGFWPVLHFAIEWYVTEIQDTMRIRFGVDLIGCMVVEEVHLFTAMGDHSLPDLEEGAASTNLDLVVGLSFSLALTAITLFEVLFKTAPLSPWTIAAGMAASAAVMFYFWLTLVTVWTNLSNGVMTYGEAAAWFYGLLIGLFTFALPGFALAGLTSTTVMKWAQTRILAQLGEAGKKTVAGIVKTLLWAKIFFAVCMVLFIGAFVVCYINAL